MGHRALRELSSRAWLNSYFDRGMERCATTYDDLKEIVSKYPNSLIVTTACLGGELSSEISALNMAEASYRGSLTRALFPHGPCCCVFPACVLSCWRLHGLRGTRQGCGAIWGPGCEAATGPGEKACETSSVLGLQARGQCYWTSTCVKQGHVSNKHTDGRADHSQVAKARGG